MFGHDVIKDLKERVKLSKKLISENKHMFHGIFDKYTKDICLSTINNIKEAKHFHIPDIPFYKNLFEELTKHNKETKLTDLFMGSLSEVKTLPSDLCWFDYETTDWSEEHNKDLIIKNGVIVESKKLSDGTPLLILMCAGGAITHVDPMRYSWYVTPIMYHICIGRKFTGDEINTLIAKHHKKKTGISVEEITSNQDFIGKFSNVFPMPLYEEIQDKEWEDAALMDSNEIILALNMWMYMSSSDSTELEDHQPMKKKVVIKKKKRKIVEVPDRSKFSYQILKVNIGEINEEDYPKILLDLFPKIKLIEGIKSAVLKQSNCYTRLDSLPSISIIYRNDIIAETIISYPHGSYIDTTDIGKNLDDKFFNLFGIPARDMVEFCIVFYGESKNNFYFTAPRDEVVDITHFIIHSSEEEFNERFKSCGEGNIPTDGTPIISFKNNDFRGIGEEIEEQKDKLQAALRYGYKSTQEKLMYWLFSDQPFYPDKEVLADEIRRQQVGSRTIIDHENDQYDPVDGEPIKRRPTDRALQGRLNVEIIYPSGKVYEGRMRATIDSLAVIEPAKGDRVAWLCDLETVRDMTRIDLSIVPYERVYHTPKNIAWLKEMSYVNVWDY